MERRAGVVATWKAVMFAPRAFFSAQSGKISGVGPVHFVAVVSLVASPVARLAAGLVSRDAQPGALVARALAFTILGPLGNVLSLYVVAALTHVVLRVLGSAKNPFAETLAAIGYATAPALLSVVPLVGAVVGGVWQFVLIFIALRRRQGAGVAAAVVGMLAVPGLAIVLALGLRFGVVEAFKIPSGSMIPTVVVGDHVFVNKLAYAGVLGRGGPARGDVIVLPLPENPNQQFVKRVVAIGGDKIEALDGRVLVDDKLAPECYVGPAPLPRTPEVARYDSAGNAAYLYVEFLGEHAYLTQYEHKHDEPPCSASGTCEAGLGCRAGRCGVVQGPWTVSKDEVFVMGDNRENSFDSRMWRGGLGSGAPVDSVTGRVSIVWMSFLPGGGIARDRIGLDVGGPPRAPSGASREIAEAIAACVAKGPTPEPAVSAP